MPKEKSPSKIQSKSDRLRAPLKARSPYSSPSLIMVLGIKQTYQDAAAWAKEITGAWFPDGAPDGYAEQVEIAEAILRCVTSIESRYYKGGLGGGYESLTKELDRLILKAQILIDPTSRTAQKKGKIRGEKISKDAAAFALKVKVKVDRIRKINSRITQLSLARKIGKELDTPTETIRGIIKKHGW